MENISQQENTLEHLYVGKLASGENVYDREGGHIHSTVKEDIPKALLTINGEGRDYVQETVSLGGKTWPHFKVTIDKDVDKENLFLAQRVSRKGLSTFIKNKSPDIVGTLVVVLSKNNKHKGQPEGYTIMTAFSGDVAPREPYDPWFDGGYTYNQKRDRQEQREQSLEYWKHHAFIPDEKEFPVVEGTEVPYDTALLKKPLSNPTKDKYIV